MRVCGGSATSRSLGDGTTETVSEYKDGRFGGVIPVGLAPDNR